MERQAPAHAILPPLPFSLLNQSFHPDLRSWSAHYKGVTCLAFSESGLLLLSGAEDTLACVWPMAELLDVAADASDPAYHRPQPLHSW